MIDYIKNNRAFSISVLAYLIATTIWAFLAEGTWDDDCVGRFYNTRDAFNTPRHFVSLWNRPLFTLLFAIPAQLGKHAITVMLVAIAVSACYALYETLKKEQIKNAFLIAPLFLFQAFYFSISRSNLTEPLAVAIICWGWYFLKEKKFVTFAVLGSLLPLARLELSVLLIFWVFILMYHKQWKAILWIALPPFLWNMGGWMIDGDPLWLISKTLGKEDEDNRYGYRSFWHYFQRYIYVLGPFVFYFFFVGLFEHVFRKKGTVFITLQLLAGFLLYVVFSWKLSLGNSAGFLRNLIPLTPMAAVLALMGYNYWLEAVNPSLLLDAKKEEPVQETREEVNTQNLSKKQQRHAKVNTQRAQEPKEETDNQPFLKAKKSFIRILILSLASVACGYYFFSKKLLFHHELKEEVDYTNLIVLSSLSLVFIVLWVVFRKREQSPTLINISAVALAIACLSFTLITEPPNNHMNPEREAVARVSDVYLKGYLKNYKTYVNHSWFFWSNNLDFPNENYGKINKENIKSAPDSSIFIWENHYSQRLLGDVKYEEIVQEKKLVELFRIVSTDRKFMTVVFQKLDKMDKTQVFSVYDRLLRQEKDFPAVYYGRSTLKTRFNDFQGAADDLNQAVSMDTLFTDAYFSRALAYFNMRNFDRAIKDFKTVVRQKSDFSQAMYNIGICYLNQNKVDDALVWMNKTIETKKDYYDAYVYRSKVYVAKGQKDKALLDLNEAIRLKPNDPENYVARGIIFNEQGKKSEALNDFDRYTKLKPKDPGGYFNKGVILYQAGKVKESCKYFKQALDLGYQPAAGFVSQYCR